MEIIIFPIIFGGQTPPGILEELKLEGRLEGKQEGIEEGILANIRTCKNFNISKEDTIRNLMKEFSLSEPEAVSYMKKYW